MSTAPVQLLPAFAKGYSPVERHMLSRLHGRRWTTDQLTKDSIAAAHDTWSELRSAAGFAGRGGWLTTGTTNPKMGKAGLPTVGVTLHSAARAAGIWDSLDSEAQTGLAVALRTTRDEIRDVLRLSVCPRSTAGCRTGCVTSVSANSRFEATQVSRLTRTLLCMFDPAAASCLLGEALRSLAGAVGEKCRWRVNVSDDLRWELLAPGLFEFGVPAYTYTKWSPTQRPGVENLSIVYSATERMSDSDIAELVHAGHRVAVVFDVPPKQLPVTWRGLTVADGDATDDLLAHAAGTVVGLCRKGPDRMVHEELRRSGFSRAV